MSKTEHEKLLAGEEYDYRDPEIQNMLAHARKYLQIVNTEIDPNKRQHAMKELFHHIGKRVAINGQIKVLYGNHISLGDDDFINDGCRFQDANLITLGDRVVIAPDCKFYCGNHAIDANKRYGTRKNGDSYLISYTKPITVGNDVWIGGNVTIIGDVHIGNNVIIGAGAIVVNDVPDNSVVAGVPAKVIKRLPELSKN
ncbi:sugar O-acetyltransferase [Limosilactobacillus reuteri]|uniref:sugar O-acetyltransferase n=1 Tax=Limosilactobacillus reuteri TaxID=1598 RepID=UPI001E6568E4|nr:sugar O-acetyltransferase [Limosilactobacillus reuteri]MCC4399587.1 sugar O-acetyltransferase [Limosilactobacillus reuteri]MCC4404517.1 sugar O-acetyltransferase [Limosilactobacillus reuteri]